MPDRAPWTSRADLIAAGLLDVAERDLEWFKRRTAKTREWSPGVQMRQFETVLRKQQRGHDGTTWLFGPAGSQTIFAAMQLADTLVANGNLAEAIATLEEAVSDRVAVIASNTPNRWLRANAQLASLYRRNGQEDKARAIEARLLKLLAHADAAHPLAAQLKARR